MFLKVISYLPSILGVLAIAVFVYQNDPKSTKNKLFALTNITIAAWLGFLFLADIAVNPDAGLWLLRFALMFGALVFVFFYHFALNFPFNSKLRRRYRLLYSVPPLVVALISLTPLTVQSVSIQDFGVQPEQLGIFYTASDILVVAYLLFGSFILLRKIKKSTHKQKNQIRLVLIGLGITAGINIVTGLVLTLLQIDTKFILFGNFSIFIFSLFVAYAVIKHGFFDIRAVVARTLGYLLSLVIIAALFAFTSILIVEKIFQGRSNSISAIILNVVIISIVVIAYPTLKSYFDKQTNKLFFRDAYDPQEFLDQLNKSIVSNIEIGILLRHTTSIIEENLKSGFVQIVVPKTESTEQRIVGTQEVKYSDHEINYMRGRLVGLARKIISVDELSSDEDELQKIMSRHDIGVLVHLSATSYGQAQTIAYMIFGNKKSGNIYSKADLKIIEIIADELVIAIQNALRFEEIQEFNVTLQSKVNTATTKLRKTNEKLKQLDETKDEFISMASHQLRTPLTSVKGYMSMVLEGDAGEINETQRQLLDQAFVSSQRMVYLIADLLNVSRLRTGKFVIDSHPSNLAELIEGEVSQLKEQAKAKNMALNYDKPKDFPELNIDETKIRQVVMNFVDNALYYTPAGGKIDVTLSSDKNHAYFMVKDNGLGVPKEEQRHLFTKFYRAKNARNIRPDGTGLGLFMAKKVITAQGGNILFDSIEGKGSTFGFSLPLKKLAVDTHEG